MRDHLIRFTDLIEASREMITDLMQTNLAAQANKLNEIMKVLTMISTTILPMSLIAGIYGMNFEKNSWPDFKESSWGFLIALGTFLLTLAISRYMSLASLAAAAVLPFAVAFTPPGDWELVVLAGLLSVLAIGRHRSNLRRLLAGTERRVGGPKPEAGQ